MTAPMENDRQSGADLLMLQAERFARGIVEAKFRFRVPYKAVTAACMTAVAKLLCHLVAEGDMTEEEAAAELERIPGFTKRLCQTDRRPIFKNR